MMEIVIKYTLPMEKELAEMYKKRIADEHIATAVPVILLKVRA